MLYYTILYFTILYCTKLYCTKLYLESRLLHGSTLDSPPCITLIMCKTCQTVRSLVLFQSSHCQSFTQVSQVRSRVTGQRIYPYRRTGNGRLNQFTYNLGLEVEGLKASGLFETSIRIIIISDDLLVLVWVLIRRGIKT